MRGSLLTEFEAGMDSSHYFARSPTRQIDVFLDFPPFVAMFLRFFGLIIHFAEGMFRIPDGLTDDF